MGCTVRGSNPSKGKRFVFSPKVQTGSGTHPWPPERGLFHRGKTTGAWRRPFTSVYIPGKEWVGVYPHSTYVSSWRVQTTFTFLYRIRRRSSVYLLRGSKVPWSSTFSQLAFCHFHMPSVPVPHHPSSSLCMLNTHIIPTVTEWFPFLASPRLFVISYAYLSSSFRYFYVHSVTFFVDRWRPPRNMLDHAQR
jgi:hypothetical protein